MLKELYTAALGMLPQQTKLEVLSNNIANAETAGYKRESVFERSLIDAAQHLNNTPNAIESADLPIGSYTDFTPGAFRKTDNPFDIAIEDKGFFTLQDEAGNIYYSRNGQFRLTNGGYLTATDGKMLVGDNGPLVLGNEFYGNPMITPDNRAVTFRVTVNGEVFANEYHLGSIQIAEIENPETLRRVSNQHFTTNEDTVVTIKQPESVSVRQGWIEDSNVDIIKEMIQMIELQRVFEAGTKVIQTNDRTLDETNKIGRYF